MNSCIYVAALAMLLVGSIASLVRGGELLVRQEAELAAACQAAQPGDAIVLADGPWQDVRLLFRAAGTPQRPITLRAKTPGGAIISGQSQLQIAGQHLVVDGLYFRGAYQAGDLIAFRRNSKELSHHCRLTNCAIVDCNPSDKQTDGKWISLYGTHNRVDHCLLRGKDHQGTTLVVWVSEEPNEHLIERNYFGHRPDLKNNGGETIRVGTSEVSMSVSRTTVQANLFEECNGEIEIVSNKSCENVYFANTFVRCEGALTLRHGNRCIVSGNFFLGQHAERTGGVRIIGEEHRVFNNYFAELEGEGARSALCFMPGIPNSPLSGYFQVQKAVVAFNTLVDCRRNIVLGLADKDVRNPLPPADCAIANNLVVGRGSTLVEQPLVPLRFMWQGNIFYGGQVGLPKMPGIKIINPRLSIGRDGLWRPARLSPVNNTAAGAYPFVEIDVDGQARGVKKDIGCDQQSSAPVTNRPLLPADVGPAWLPTAAVK